ncbi:233_t:CDS:2, partial [Acaulospora colombiana]
MFSGEWSLEIAIIDVPKEISFLRCFGNPLYDATTNLINFEELSSTQNKSLQLDVHPQENIDLSKYSSLVFTIKYVTKFYNIFKGGRAVVIKKNIDLLEEKEGEQYFYDTQNTYCIKRSKDNSTELICLKIAPDILFDGLVIVDGKYGLSK